MLTTRYLDGIPADSRAARDASLDPEWLSAQYLASIRGLQEIAESRGQTVAQLAVAWTLRDRRVTSTLIGASSVAQLHDTLGAVANLDFSAEELAAIDTFAHDAGINIWEDPTRIP